MLRRKPLHLKQISNLRKRSEVLVLVENVELTSSFVNMGPIVMHNDDGDNAIEVTVELSPGQRISSGAIDLLKEKTSTSSFARNQISWSD